jgi:hypothetical protein
MKRHSQRRPVGSHCLSDCLNYSESRFPNGIAAPVREKPRYLNRAGLGAPLSVRHAARSRKLVQPYIAPQRRKQWSAVRFWAA